MNRRLAIGAACAAALAGACAAPPPDGTTETDDETFGDPPSTGVDARYVTHMLFVAADGRAFFATFDQTAQGPQLARDYEVRMTEGGSWRQLARVRDTLPTARAGWRLLPAPGLSVRVGDAGQVVSLEFVDSDAEGGEPVRLVAGEQVSVWTGPTGQLESLGIALLESGREGIPGMLFFRRGARALRIPSAAGDGETLLFADSLGNGFVIHGGDHGQPAVGHTWLHGIGASWGEITLTPAAPESAAARRFEIAGTELWGTFRPLPGDVASAGDVVRLEAVLHIGGEAFPFTGLLATLPSP